MTMGVYAIRNTRTGARYIGSSVCIEERARQHMHYLSRLAERHPPGDQARPFVRDWLQYGQDAFEVDVLEVHHVTVPWNRSPEKEIRAMRARELWYIRNTPCEYNRKKPSRPALHINYSTTGDTA